MAALCLACPLDLTRTLETVMGAFADVVNILCLDPSNPLSVW